MNTVSIKNKTFKFHAPRGPANSLQLEGHGLSLWDAPESRQTPGIYGHLMGIFHLPFQSINFRKWNLAFVHQATLGSPKTSNFKIKYSFDPQARSRKQDSTALTFRAVPRTAKGWHQCGLLLWCLTVNSWTKVMRRWQVSIRRTPPILAQSTDTCSSWLRQVTSVDHCFEDVNTPFSL